MPWSTGTYSRAGGSTNWADDRDAGTEIEAGLHDTHDNDLATGINQCLNKDGSNAATGDLDAGGYKINNVGTGTASTDAVNKAQLDAVSAFPTGGIIPFAGSTLPGAAGDWLVCDGSEVSRTTYSDLFTALGNGSIYGVGDGSTTFNLPDLQGRVIAGIETTENRLTASYFGEDGTALGQTGGSESHQLTVAELATHNHTFFDSRADNSGSNNNIASQVGTIDTDGGFNSTTNSTGGNQPHNNVQPTMIMNYIIKT